MKNICNSYGKMVIAFLLLSRLLQILIQRHTEFLAFKNVMGSVSVFGWNLLSWAQIETSSIYWALKTETESSHRNAVI
jgi:hypothetical protein